MAKSAALPDGVIAEYERTNGEKVRATVSDFKGTKYLSIRAYYKTASGSFAPGKNGINLPVSEAKAFFDIATALDDAVTNLQTK